MTQITDTDSLASIAGFVPPPNKQQAETPQWLYDEIMRWIEPDLMLNVIPNHQKIYANETQEQRNERMAYYDQAFAQFDAIYSQFSTVFFEQAKELAHVAQAQAHSQEAQAQRDEVQAAEAALNSSATPV